MSGVGTAALLAVPGFQGPVAAATIASGSGSGTSGSSQIQGVPTSFFYLYVNSDPLSTGGPSLTSMRGASAPAPVSTAPLATIPIRSPDQALVATVSLVTGATGGVLSASFIDAGSAQAASTVTVPIPSAVIGTLTTATLVFSADSSTLCVVLSVMTPRVPTQLAQPRWVTHHELVFIDVPGSSATGPFVLDDSPTLPAVNLFADSQQLHIWTMWAATDVPSTSGPNPSLASTQFASFPFGSGAPSIQTKVAGTWPSTTGQNVVGLQDGSLARVIGCQHVEIYQPDTAAMTRSTITPFAGPTAKPGRPVVQALPGGNVLVVNPALGVAAVLDGQTIQPVTTVTFLPPRFPNSGSPAAAASPDGSTLYVLGGRTTGGVNAYRIADGSPIASLNDGRQYSGIHQTASSGQVLAIAPTSPKLTVLTPGLSVVGTADTPAAVAAAV
ncbi:MAG: hypothetical protein ACYDHU_12415 [Acidimicrobiales bacterium]